MAKRAVLAIGIEPAFADFNAFPNLTPELIRHHINAQMTICVLWGTTPKVV